MKLNIFLFWILVILVTVDIIHSICKAADSLINWTDIILVAFLIFVVFGERISKFAVNLKGITIEQKVANTVKGAKALAGLESDNSKLTNIDKILSTATGQEKGIWSQLVIYRLTLRSLLRKICRSKGMVLGDATSFTQMLTYIREQDALPVCIQAEIEKIRDVTFFFEWGTGTPPDETQIKEVLTLAPKTLVHIVKVANEIVSQ